MDLKNYIDNNNKLKIKQIYFQDYKLLKNNVLVNSKIYDIYENINNNKKYFVKKYNKFEIFNSKTIDNLYNEINLMSSLSNSLIVNLNGINKNELNINLFYDYFQGQEFFDILKKKEKFNINETKFFSSLIILFFDYMHENDIIYRDLKPENLFLNEDGYLKFTENFFIKKLVSRTYTICGTPEYMSPEMLKMKGYGFSHDWWTLGIFIYECLVGFPPFIDDDPLIIYNKILDCKLFFPKFVSFDSKNLIKKLLKTDLSQRLGNLNNKSLDIKKHEFFKNCEFKNIKLLKPLIKPEIIEYIPIEYINNKENNYTLEKNKDKIFDEW